MQLVSVRQELEAVLKTVRDPMPAEMPRDDLLSRVPRQRQLWQQTQQSLSIDKIMELYEPIIIPIGWIGGIVETEDVSWPTRDLVSVNDNSRDMRVLQILMPEPVLEKYIEAKDRMLFQGLVVYGPDASIFTTSHTSRDPILTGIWRDPITGRLDHFFIAAWNLEQDIEFVKEQKPFWKR